MAEHTAMGVVVNVADGLAQVRLNPGAGGCGSGGCGKCGGEKHAAVVAAFADVPLAPGDCVKLLELVSPLRAAGSVFGVPLVLMLVAGLAGQWLGNVLRLPGRGAELVAFLGGLLGVIAGLLFAARLARRGPRAAWRVLAKVEKTA